MSSEPHTAGKAKSEKSESTPQAQTPTTRLSTKLISSRYPKWSRTLAAQVACGVLTEEAGIAKHAAKEATQGILRVPRQGHPNCQPDHPDPCGWYPIPCRHAP